jgi:hypothetical protein
MASVGTREQVWNGSAGKTSGGLSKNDLMMSKTGHIVSKKQSEAARARIPELQKAMCAKLSADGYRPSPAKRGDTLTYKGKKWDIPAFLADFTEGHTDRAKAKIRRIVERYKMEKKSDAWLHNELDNFDN